MKEDCINQDFIDWLICTGRIKSQVRDTWGMCLVFSSRDVPAPVVVPLTDDDGKDREPIELVRLLKSDVGSYKIEKWVNDYLNEGMQ